MICFMRMIVFFAGVSLSVSISAKQVSVANLLVNDGANMRLHSYAIDYVYPTREIDERDRCGVESYPDATASFAAIQESGRTRGVLEVHNVRPLSSFTIWLRLDEKSPLTGKGVTPFSASADIPAIVEVSPLEMVTPELRTLLKVGQAERSNDFDIITNGFSTDAQGYGRLVFDVDYKLFVDGQINGKFPFSAINPALKDASIATPHAMDLRFFTIISHCTDGNVNGMTGRTPSFGREVWFQIIGKAERMGS